MPSEKKWAARWLCDSAFAPLEPRDLFRKELAPEKKIQPHDEKLLNRHMLVRKSFKLERVPAKPRIDISADDSYKLYVNGRFAAEGPADSYPFRYRYDSVDLSGFLVEGENLIAVDVFYQGLVNRVWVSGDYRQGLIAELFDGERRLLASDASWRAKTFSSSIGAKFGYDTQFAEDIDARVMPDRAWRELAFDDSAWTSAVEKKNDSHILVKSEIPTLCSYSVKPATARSLDGGRIVYDFGTELAGRFACSAFGRAGDQILIRHAEELAADGSALPLRCNCDYRETWTLSGSQPDRLEYCDYKAFRYVELKVPDGVRVEDVETVVRHYPLLPGKAAEFASSDKLLKGIWDICAQGAKLGSQTAFLDCPTREKGPYLGDMTVTANAHLHLSGDARLFKKALRDFADSAFICPGLMAVAPSSYMQEIADYSLQYPLQLLMFYKHSGDAEALAELLPAAEGMMRHFKLYERADGLLQNLVAKWNLVDWPQNLRDGYDFNLDRNKPGAGPHAVLNAFYAVALSAMDELRALAGKPSPSEFQRVKKAFVKAFYREGAKLFVDSEISKHSSLHSNALALYAGLAPEDSVESVVRLIEEKGLACGVYMSYFVLKGLGRAGRCDALCKLLLNEGEHSWANMLREGATSCFEAWGKTQKWNTSLCHPWAAAPIPLIVEDLLGVSPLKPGYSEIGVAPRLPASFPDFSLALSLPTARLAFAKKGEALRLEASLNEGCETVELRAEGLEAATLEAKRKTELELRLR